LDEYANNAKVFMAFCDETRLRVLKLLQSGEKCAGALLEQVRVGQSTLSHHMKILLESGIVTARKAHKWTYYSICENGKQYATALLKQLTSLTAEVPLYGERGGNMTIYKPLSPKGVREEIPEATDLRDALRRVAKTYAEKDAFYVKKDGSYHGITYKQFEAEVNALGTYLVSNGMKNEKIAVIGENSYEWCLTYMSVVCGVGVIVPLDKELPENEIINLLTRSKASAIVYSKKLEPVVNKLLDSCPDLKRLICMDTLKTLVSEGTQLIENGDASFLDAVIDPNALGILVFTSGTTDLAKGVMLSHSNIIFDIRHVLELLYLGSEDSVLSILPLHHTYECTCGFLTIIFGGGRISFAESMKSIAKNLQEVNPTVLFAVPLILENLYKKIIRTVEKSIAKKYLLKTAMPVSNFLRKAFELDVSKKIFKDVHKSIGGNVRLIVSGAAALNPDVAKGFEAMGVTIRQGYGLTEASPIISVNRLDKYNHASIGPALPGMEVEIHDPDANGIGELRARGGNIMLGYYENDEATNKVLKDGWLYTGDIGYKDEDDYFYITGRQKNVIVTKNGKNIFPEEVEAYLNNSPYILESLIKGVELENGETKVCAEVVVDQEELEEKGKTSLSGSELHDLIDKEIKSINKQMPLYKRIAEFTIREEAFEKTTTKKIKRHK